MITVRHWTFAAAFVVAGLTTLALAVSGQDSPEEDLMKAKSRYAHALLDAIIQEDFETIREQAFGLKAVAMTASWKISENEAYIRISDAFIQSTNAIYDAAEQENGDAAALAYMDMTLKCMGCHRYLKNVDLEPDER